MAKINLLPWREELQKQKQQDFIATIGLGVIVTLAGLMYLHMHISGNVEYQQQRNQYLVKEIAAFDTQIKEIAELDSKKESMIARMDVIQTLQVSRPQVVHLFEELALTIPDGVYLEKLKQTSSRLSVAGVSQSNSRVSEYMRNIDVSEWLNSPDLRVITANKKNAKDKHDKERVHDFKLDIKQISPQTTEEQAGDKA